MSLSSFSTLLLYFWINRTTSDSFVYLDSSFVSMEDDARHDARRAPMTFL